MRINAGSTSSGTSKNRYRQTFVIDKSSLERDRSTRYRSTSAVGSGPNINGNEYGNGNNS